MSSIDEWTHDIHQGDAAETLRKMPESSVHCVMTSPPYFGLRDYGVDGQIGLEDSLDQYVESIVEVGEALRRVLRPDGNWWLNLGDSFGGDSIVRGDGEWTRPGDDGYEEAHTSEYGDGRRSMSSLGRKNKLLVPHRVAIALQEAGWVVRQDCVWYKPNPMPNPVNDRHNEQKEFLFHLTPAPDYWFDLDTIREPHKPESVERAKLGFDGSKQYDHERYPDRESEEQLHNFSGNGLHPNGKNPGDVFEITVKPFPDAHFAVYPPELCEAPIQSSCPDEVCADCGAPRRRITEEIPLEDLDVESLDRDQRCRALEIARESDLEKEHFEALRSIGITDAEYGQVQIGTGRNTTEVEQLAGQAMRVLGSYAREFTVTKTEPRGWEWSCDCETDETQPGIVLDPFAGAGTTCLVAKRLGRRFIGIDLNAEYVAMAQKRVGVTVDEPELLLEDDETALTAFADGGEDDVE